MKCRHCNTEQDKCYRHCHESDDGKHVADALSAQQADDMDFVVDYACIKCGISGSVMVNPDDIMWE